MRKTRIAVLALALVGLCVLYGPSVVRTVRAFWDNEQYINFWAAWIPFGVSVLLAFIPQQMKPTARITWRVSIICCGLFYSLLLWHQQALNGESSVKAQQGILNEAVAKSNAHSDEQIGGVRKDVHGVKDDVGGVKTDLQQTRDTLAKMLSSSESNITSSVGRMGRPEPARIQASLWPTDQDVSWPVTRRTIVPDDGGAIAVDLTFKNVSDAAASNVDIWFEIGTNSHFAVEPTGFDRPQGTIETIRHRVIPLLNPGVTMEKITFTIKIDKPFTGSEISFKYSCQGCVDGTSKKQVLMVARGFRPYG
jgi:hypothetical protein